MAAAALARNSEQYAAVQRDAVALLLDADEQTSNAIARALAYLPPRKSRLTSTYWRATRALGYGLSPPLSGQSVRRRPQSLVPAWQQTSRATSAVPWRAASVATSATRPRGTS